MKTRTVAVIMTILVCASVVHAGVSYTAVTKTRDAKGRSQQTSKMRAVVDGMNARIDFDSGKNGAVPRGGYLLTRDGAKTVFMVNTQEETYMKWDIDKLAGMAGSIMQMAGGMLNMSVTNHKNEKLLDEKGPTMMGVPTRHYKFLTRYGMEVNVMGFKQKSDVATEQEIWAGQGLADDATALWKRITSFKTGIEDIDKLIADEAGKVKGFPLRTIVKSTTTDQRGRKQTTETVTEVTDMKKLKPNPKIFVIPNTYTEEQMELPPGNSSAKGENNPAAAINGLLKSFGR
ncbi:MAG: hypothetical protein ISS31_03910 [Kiritimatiellae bacterium]|nr:hypothetical protein [Kiritimatiellia bacterium]